MPSMGKHWESRRGYTEEAAASTKFKLGTRREQMLLFLTGTRLLNFMEIMQKNEVCNKLPNVYVQRIT